jgi:hypothetical protein
MAFLTLTCVLFVGGQRRKDKGGLYVWIYLDSEDLMAIACKELPAEIASEEGIGQKDSRAATDYELEDNIGESARVKKRVKSATPSTPSSRYVDGDAEYATPLHQIASAVTSMTTVKNSSGNVTDDQVKAAQANESNALADESKIRALTALSTHADQDIAAKAKSLILSQLEKWGA